MGVAKCPISASPAMREIRASVDWDLLKAVPHVLLEALHDDNHRSPFRPRKAQLLKIGPAATESSLA